MHSSRMCTAHIVSDGGGVCPTHLDADTPWMQTPLDADLPSPWTEGMTHSYENITLPQTSFANGN